MRAVTPKPFQGLDKLWEGLKLLRCVVVLALAGSIKASNPGTAPSLPDFEGDSRRVEKGKIRTVIY